MYWKTCKVKDDGIMFFLLNEIYIWIAITMSLKYQSEIYVHVTGQAWS